MAKLPDIQLQLGMMVRIYELWEPVDSASKELESPTQARRPPLKRWTIINRPSRAGISPK
ncbi:hypothetical protein GKODMF_11040 [Candidatus Electrothrix gigas]